ncbi:uncharacterized protein TRIADDRAFT_55610 [Trichoplax adhaerens]|uniref:Cytoplasmic tRNA 2-thiolation protein 2 n=1 Tax=Trichoplax adhaerens TaxID=10228 RepID=B3RVD1_TRIAD|nr:hypothetical protein TRIADDRAFT_55610 [Trichoplax adhaerens]EDV25973.1 hypothetical protein TRIADDRAFT_55610 [Trichoplax adhaerens]|eukprot:XP_002112006.1 hypothetical protein TRIADDRAFT_55610 [Trichoplax adhaerens]
MCNVEDQDLLPPSKAKNASRTCIKCKEVAQIVLRADNCYCRSCFIAYFTHKFRATIGKSKLIRSNEKVLLAFSGGPRSSAMLYLVHEGLSENIHKKLRFLPGVVFIDDGAILQLSENERRNYLEFIRTTVSKTGFPLFCESLGKIFPTNQDTNIQSNLLSSDLSNTTRSDATSSSNFDLDTLIKRFKNDELKIVQVFEKLPNSTAKEDMLHILRKKLIQQIAEANGYTKVMFADCGTRLAVKILSDIAQGRGSSVAHDVTFADERNQAVTLVRPMREFLTKEVANYLTLKSIDYRTRLSLTTMKPVKSSIERLTENFVTDLQASFPSTVNTICRTGDKLSVGDTSKIDADAICPLCDSRIDTNNSLEGKTTSKTTSKICQNTADSCCGEGDGSCNRIARINLTAKEIEDRLCYGCRLIFHSNNWEMDDLPQFLIDAIEKQLRRKRLKEEIEEFLLD